MRPQRSFGGQSEVATLRRAYLKHPVAAAPDQQAVDGQWRALGYRAAPDLARAVAEFEAFRAVLDRAGVETEQAPADEVSLDSIYVRDAAVLSDRGAILCNMGKEARRAEPAALGRALTDLGVPVLGRIEGAGRLEGGDVMWLEERTLAVGLGYRTNQEGARQLRGLLGDAVDDVVTVPLPHWRGPDDVFHLMSMLSPLDRDLGLAFAPLLPVPFRESLIERGYRLVEVPAEEFDSLGCNVLALAPGRVLAVDGNPITRARLEAAGVEVEVFKGHELCVPGGGGPTCLTLPILRSE